MANTSIYAAFERMWQHVVTKLGEKANTDHSHNDVYYTETEIDTKLSEVNTSIAGITNGDTIVAEAEHAASADIATSATSATTAETATQDGSGNVIVDTYETKEDATAKLDEAKEYADSVASGKADAEHSHAISDITSLQSSLDAKVPTSRTVNGKALSANITLSASDVGADASGSASSALASAKTYSDTNLATAKSYSDANLAEAKSYADELKDSLVNGAGSAYDTLLELGNLIDDNTDAIDALETVAAGKQATITGAATTITSSNLTTNRALISNSSGKVAVSDITSTELGYLDGVTSNIQTQLNAKAASSHTHKVSEISDLTATATELNYMDGVTSSVQAQLDGKSSTSHTHSVATSSANGFMSPTDKSKLDGITESADSVQFSQSLTSGTAVGTITINGTGTTMYAPTNTDTKNTAGSTDSSKKLFLIGAESQAANPQTYSHDTAYVGTDGCLYSGGSKVLTAHPTISVGDDTTSTASPAHSGTFTAVDSVTRDGNGHVTKINTKTVTLPAQYTHPSYTARTGVPTANATPAFGGTVTVSQITSDATGHVTGATDRTITIPSTTATQSASGLMSAEDKIQMDYGGIPIVTTSGTGAAYTATVDGMTALTNGMKVTIIPHTVSTTTAPTLNVNSLGAKTIRMPIAYNTSTTSAGAVAAWLAASKPVTLEYNGTYWITIGLTRPTATSLSGTVAIANGGTGATTAATALTNLGLTATAAELNTLDGITATVTELNYCDGVTSNIQTQLNAKASTEHNHKGQNINPSCLELGSGASGHGGYIDFHYNDSTDDYTSRIIESASGTINVDAKLTTTGTINGYTLAAACAKGVTDSNSASAISTGTSLPTERDIYYGLPTINGSHTYTSSTNIYAPTSVGTAGYYLRSNGSGAPSWVAGSGGWNVKSVGTATTCTDQSFAIAASSHDFLFVVAIIGDSTQNLLIPLGMVSTLGTYIGYIGYSATNINVSVTSSAITFTKTSNYDQTTSLKVYYMDRK